MKQASSYSLLFSIARGCAFDKIFSAAGFLKSYYFARIFVAHANSSANI
jgi:hypothetical protein